MLIGYARVSTTGQNLESQIEHLQAEGCDTVFQEKLTGFDRRRPQLEMMLSSLQADDTLLVTSLDRLARSTNDLCGSHGRIRQARWGSSCSLFLRDFPSSNATS